MKTLATLLRNNIREYGMLIALVAIMIFFQYQTEGVLLKPINITNLFLQNSYVIVMALGMLLVIVAGWIDLSVGSIAAFVGAIAAVMMIKYEVNWFLAILIGLAAGALIGAWRLVPAGTEGYAKAEVTLGGVDTAALSQKTMAAKDVPGLFVVGEAVDITGWLGGYNFQWAWSSGWAAGEHA